MNNEPICARCNQPIEFRQLYHKATRAAQILSKDGTESAIVPGQTVVVHDYPCPTHMAIVNGTLVVNGADISPADHDAPSYYAPLMVEMPALASFDATSAHNLRTITEDADGCGYKAICNCGTGFSAYTERGARGAHAMHQGDNAPPPACCGGGPQWGHAWECRSLP